MRMRRCRILPPAYASTLAAVEKLYAKLCAGKHLLHRTLHFDHPFFGHPITFSPQGIRKAA
jgi:hypothetical protein